jgi:acetyl-CoA carboxylase carboxyl transferase subunit alpha
LGGAHQNPVEAATTLKQYLLKHLNELLEYSPEGLVEQRYQRFRAMTEIEED